MLLRESLGNLNCRTTMIAHISAAAASYAETLSTIQIASRVLRMKKKKTKVRGARRARAARSCGGPARSPVGKSRARTSNPWAPGPGAQRPRKETENPQAGPGTVPSRPRFPVVQPGPRAGSAWPRHALPVGRRFATGSARGRLPPPWSHAGRDGVLRPAGPKRVASPLLTWRLLPCVRRTGAWAAGLCHVRRWFLAGAKSLLETTGLLFADRGPARMVAL